MLYSAAAGEGVWVERGGMRTPLSCMPAPESLRLVGSRSHAEPMLIQLQTALNITDVAPGGSVGVKCSRIAEGERDLHVHPVPYLKEWDTCVPELLLREAGGWVSDCSGEPLVYNKPSPRQPHGILACRPGVAPRVLPVLRTLYEGILAAAVA